MTTKFQYFSTIKSKVILLLSLLVFLLILSVFNYVEANMGPPPPTGDNSGLTFANNNDISVESQLLVIDFLSDMTFDIQAIYTMKNLTDSPISIASTFMSPIYHGSNLREYVIYQGTVLLEYTTKLIVHYYSIDYNTGEATLETKEISSLDEIDPWDYAYSLVTFIINFNAFETLDVSFSYNYQPNLDTRTTTNPNNATLFYLLTPARYWASYSNLEITVSLFSGHIRQSNLNFERNSARNYTFTSETLPLEELRLTVSTMPAGFAFIQHGNMFLFFLSIFIYVLIVALMVYLITIICIKAKRKSRSNANITTGILSVVFFSLALFWLAISFNWWIAFGFNMGHLVLYFFSFISLIIALGVFIGFAVTLSHTKY